MNRAETFRVFNVGDEVELIVGKYAGIRGKIIGKRPRLAPFANRILVDVDLKDYDRHHYQILSAKFKKWQRAASWKMVA